MTLAMWAFIVATFGQILVTATVVYLGRSFLGASVATGNMATTLNNMQQSFAGEQKALEDLISWSVPSDQWAGVIELYQTINQDYDGEKLDYLLYAPKREAYWEIGDNGYTKVLAEAKRFTAYEGLLITLDQARNQGPHECYVLVGVAKPEDI